VRATVPQLEAAEGVARRRWEQLAGPGADPADVDAVVHRYDPGQRLVADLVGHHPAVRAADRVAGVHRAAWVQAWRCEVGDAADPFEMPDLGAALEGWAPAGPPPSVAAPMATVVLAAPYADLSDDRARALHQRLLHLPAGPRVIVVLGPDITADVPDVDLTGPLPVVDLTRAGPAAADPSAADVDVRRAHDRPSVPARPGG
ncbi:MAG TPA: hypothetical protein VHK88_07870, partial [Aquihabitans sp.]|nr:hypothetical protein [Aquihabitans sp.]